MNHKFCVIVRSNTRLRPPQAAYLSVFQLFILSCTTPVCPTDCALTSQYRDSAEHVCSCGLTVDRQEECRKWLLTSVRLVFFFVFFFLVLLTTGDHFPIWTQPTHSTMPGFINSGGRQHAVWLFYNWKLWTVFSFSSVQSWPQIPRGNWFAANNWESHS